MDIRHDRTQTSIYLFCCPFETHRVLGHLQTTGSYTTGIRCLTRAVQDLCALENRDCFRCRRHVRTFGHAETAILDQVLGIAFLYLVLRCARHSDVARDLPRTLTSEILSLRILGCVLFNTSATDVLEFEHKRHLLLVQTFRIIDKAIGIAKRQHFSAKTHSFLSRILSNVTGSRDAHFLTLETLSTSS